MEIIIHDKNAFSHLMKEGEVFWQLLVRRNRKIFLIQYVIGIILTIIGFSPVIDTVNKTEYVNNITHENRTIYEHSSFNLVGAFGIAYIILTSALLFGQFRRKEAFLDEASLRYKKIYQQSNESTIIIRDDNISFETPVSKNICKWKLFASYSLYKNYIILNISKSGANAFAINRQLLSDELNTDLISFLRHNMQEKKV